MVIPLINVRLKPLFLKGKDQDVSVVINLGIIVPIVLINLKRKRKNPHQNKQRKEIHLKHPRRSHLQKAG